MIRIFTFLTILLNSVTCKTQTLSEIVGNVYIANELLSKKDTPYDSIFPILALRVDAVLSKRLLVKYRFGNEQHMDVDFIYDDCCACWQSRDIVLFAPNGSEKKRVFLQIKTLEEIHLFFLDSDGSNRSYIYNKTYKARVDLSKHRDVYYAEDGFALFMN